MLQYVNVNSTKQGKLARDVAIVGIGNTPWVITHKNEEWSGITEHEMFATAANAAMDDAGLTGADIDALVHSQLFGTSSATINAQVMVEEWLGMRGKPGWHVEGACTSPGIAVATAMYAIASGAYDTVLAGGVDIAQSRPKHNMPACFREPQTSADLGEIAGLAWQDPDYTRYVTDGGRIMMEQVAEQYRLRNHLTDKDIEDAFLGINITDSRSAALHPDAIQKESYDELAKAAGKDVWDYMRSVRNPKLGKFTHVSGTAKYADGAAAIVLTTVEKAREIEERTGKKAIIIKGSSWSNIDHRVPDNVQNMNATAWKELQDLTGVTGDDLDLVMTPNYVVAENLEFVEMIGYMPEGEAWKYWRDGETAFDGKKPMSIGGNVQSFGHVYGAGGLFTICESVRQMRGEGGKVQMPTPPRTTLVRSQGGAQGTILFLLETMTEGPQKKITPHLESLKPDRTVLKFYEGLAEGKLLGRKCKDCGHVIFPPTYGCNECGGHNTELVEISPEATLRDIVPTTGISKAYPQFSPYVMGDVTLEGGSTIPAVIRGIDDDNFAEIEAKLPVKVKAAFVEMPEGYTRFVFDLAE